MSLYSYIIKYELSKEKKTIFSFLKYNLYCFLSFIRTRVKIMYETSERIIYWGWKLRNSHDWDYGYMEDMLLYKLQRMEKGVYLEGHHVWSKKSREYRALKEIIHILKTRDNFKTKFFKSQKVNSLLSRRSEYEMGELMKIDELHDQRLDRAYDLLKKWRKHWWD